MKFLVAIFCTAFLTTASAQPRYNALLLDTLQEIAGSNTPSKHFARLYYKAIESTNGYTITKPDSVKQFIFGFESVFAPAFFRSYRNYLTHQPQEFSWQHYYADTGLNELQYQFMGMNAHINGDMWRALKDKYGYDTLKKYRQPLLQFQKTLNSFFDSIYTATVKYKKVKRLHLFTLGADKIMGRQMIFTWRRRQVQMALLFYSNPAKCKRKLRRVKKRMQHYDKFAANWIK
ncbi:DUF5995 family protein [Ferruginibacter profundus]